MINLICSFMWALTGAIATKYYGESYEENVFNPLSIYIAFCFMEAGVELAKLAG